MRLHVAGASVGTGLSSQSWDSKTSLSTCLGSFTEQWSQGSVKRVKAGDAIPESCITSVLLHSIGQESLDNPRFKE